jgi:hypothetical protein
VKRVIPLPQTKLHRRGDVMTVLREEWSKGYGHTFVQVELGHRLRYGRLTGFDSLRDLLLVLCIVAEGSLHFLVSQREGRGSLGGGMATEIIAHDDPYWGAFVADEGFFTEIGSGVPCGTVMWRWISSSGWPIGPRLPPLLVLLFSTIFVSPCVHIGGLPCPRPS